MTAQSTIEDVSTGELYVLLGLTALNQSGVTPANSLRVEDVCESLPDPEGGVVGKLSEAEVTKTLYALESDGLVDEHEPDDSTPAGKGRPEYDLAVDPATVRDAAMDRSTLASVVAELPE